MLWLKKLECVKDIEILLFVNDIKMTTTSDADILAKIEKFVKVDGECKLWCGFSGGKSNRPMFRHPHIKSPNGKGKLTDVQRLLWNMTHDNIKRSEMISTTCSNGTCVNPDHLIAIPQKPAFSYEKTWERMLKKTKKEGDCLIWTGGRTNKYGSIGYRGKTTLLHRAVYMIKMRLDIIPKTINGLEAHVCHTCGNPLCISQEHLELNTILHNNNEDKEKHGTTSKGENNPQSKITQETAHEIKISKKNKGDEGYETRKQRADRFGVSVSVISSIDSGQSWSHVEDSEGNSSTTTNLRKRKREVHKINRSRQWTEEQFEVAGGKLYSKISRTEGSKIDDISGECWEYTGYKRDGYGTICVFGKTMRSHILSCEIKNKRHKKKNEVVRHLCGNSICVNPTHLQFGDNISNSIDALRHGSRVAKLDEEKVIYIRKSTLSILELSKKYNISTGTVRSVIKGDTWKHVVEI